MDCRPIRPGTRVGSAISSRPSSTPSSSDGNPHWFRSLAPQHDTPPSACSTHTNRAPTLMSTASVIPGNGMALSPVPCLVARRPQHQGVPELSSAHADADPATIARLGSVSVGDPMDAGCAAGGSSGCDAVCEAAGVQLSVSATRVEHGRRRRTPKCYQPRWGPAASPSI